MSDRSIDVFAAGRVFATVQMRQFKEQHAVHLVVNAGGKDEEVMFASNWHSGARAAIEDLASQLDLRLHGLRAEVQDLSECRRSVRDAWRAAKA
jgi:hypothetical protein